MAKEEDFRSHILDSKITVSSFHTTEGAKEGIEFPVVLAEVVPRTNEWLVVEERTWEEVNSVVDGMAQGIYLSITNKGINSPYLIGLGVKEEPDTHTARVLAFASLYQRQLDLVSPITRERDNLLETYNQEKQKIRQKQGQTRSATRKINSLYDKEYGPKIRRLNATAATRESVGDLVLRHGAVDIFSANDPSLLEELPDILDNLKTISPRGYQMTTQFLRGMGEYLSKSTDSALFARYSYKRSPDIVSKHSDVEVLNLVLRRYFMVDAFAHDVEVSGLTQSLSSSFLIFIKNQAVYLSKTGIHKGFPHLMAIYDIATVAFSTTNLEIVDKTAAQVIDALFESLSHQKRFEDECRELALRYFRTVEQLALRGLGFLDSEATSESLRAKLRGDAEQTARELPVRMLTGFSLMQPDVFSFVSGYRFNSATINNIVRQCGLLLNKEYRRLDKNMKTAHTNYQWALATALGEELKGDQVTVDLARHFHRQVSVDSEFFKSGLAERVITGVTGKQLNVIEMQRLGREKAILLLLDQDDISTASGSDVFLADYLAYLFEKPDSERVGRQNERLWRAILDESKWFVSPRKDRFSEERDPELGEYGIASITFGINRRYPREHEVSIRFKGSPKEMVLWLTKEGQVLLKDRSLLRANLRSFQPFVNVILRRLYIITSAMLSENQQLVIRGGEESGPTFEWRRAHYRIFKAGSRFRLHSPSAKLHAKEIKAIYGIDIYQENQRRQEAGSLEQDQVMTFVREVAPAFVKETGPIPNELPFDPAWIPATL